MEKLILGIFVICINYVKLATLQRGTVQTDSDPKNLNLAYILIFLEKR